VTDRCSDAEKVLSLGSSEVGPEPSENENAVVRVMHEMSALNAALRVAEGLGGDVQEALLLSRTYLARFSPETVEERVIEVSIRKILGEAVEAQDLSGAPVEWEGYVQHMVATAWLFWMGGNPTRARAQLVEVQTKRKAKTFADKKGSLHLFTLYFWSQAISELLDGDRAAARRYFKRSIELGAQFGTDSHPMISWAFAGTFFEEGVRFTST
jgi:hypothetical protein